MTKPTGRPPGRPRLKAGEDAERVVTWIPTSTRRKAAVRRAQLGMSESEWVRRLIENAVLGVPSDAADDV